MTSELAGIVDVEWEGETTEWIENEMYTWRSIYGHFTGFGSMTLNPIDTGTKFTIVMDYGVPYSIFGKLIDKLLIHEALENEIDVGLKKLADMMKN